MLSMDFTKLILISFFLAAPISVYIMNNWWLQDFPYRIQISPITIIISGLSAILLTWVTVGYQSLKASIQNPVKSLRNE